MDTETISTFESKSDTELMEAVGRRESDAMQEIYKRYESTLRTVIQSVLHDDSETDDALNDVFLQALGSIRPIHCGKRPAGFLVTMARRRALDRLRRRLAYHRTRGSFRD